MNFCLECDRKGESLESSAFSIISPQFDDGGLQKVTFDLSRFTSKMTKSAIAAFAVLEQTFDSNDIDSPQNNMHGSKVVLVALSLREHQA